MDIVLTIGISTVRNNLENAKQVFLDCGDISGVEFLIVSQFHDVDCMSHENGIFIECNQSRGLSRNRNRVIDLANGEYVWFLDDDVVLSKEKIADLINVLKNQKADVVVGRIACSDTTGFYKNYAKVRKGILGILRTSSIEVVANRTFILENKIRFREDMGLGTDYPSGEENLFLLDCRANKARFQYLSYAFVSHPCLLEKKDPKQIFKDRKLLESKAILATRMSAVSGFVYLIYMVVKSCLHTRKISPGITIIKKYISSIST